MNQNYFKIALRYFRRNKLYALINVLGLAIGMAACLIIFSIVRFESGFDRQWDQRESIFRVYSSFSGVFQGVNRGVPTGVPSWVRSNMPEAEAVAPFHIWNAPVTIIEADGSKKELEDQSAIAIVDTGYFKIFSKYQWLRGSPQESLTDPQRVVLTPEKVSQYFGTNDIDRALGRSLIYHDSLTLVVSGIVESLPFSSDLNFKEFISFPTIENSWLKNWITPNDWSGTNSSSQLFLKLGPTVSKAQAEERLAGANAFHKTQNKDATYIATYLLQPLEDLHFNSEIGIFDSSRPPAHRPTLYLLALVALILVVIAAVNFINLETAQSLKRAREVGVRKVLGGTRPQLMKQFLSSTLLLTLIAMIIALGLTQLAIVYYDDFIPDGLEFRVLEPATLSFILFFTVMVCLIAGSYPAFVLSSFLPIRALRNQLSPAESPGSNTGLRHGLVIFQFVVAQILIFGTLTVGQQIKYMLSKDMGFDKDAIVYFYTPWRDTTNRNTVLLQELKQIPELIAVSNHQSPPAQSGYTTSVMVFRKGEEKLSFNVQHKFGDTAYIHLYGMDLLAGRNLTPNDTLREFLINETFIRQLGFEQPQAALDQLIYRNDEPYRIVGVVNDFHTRSLHTAIEPTAIANRPGKCISIKLHTHDKSAQDLSALIEKVEGHWNTLYPEEPFNYHFVDEAIAQFYKRDRQTAQLVNSATGIAIFICCLGLFGLISFTTTQRTKEIGIRKILGASVLNIISLLVRNFLLLVLIALLIAAPVAWWLSSRWLEDFAYRIDLQWWQIIVVGLAALGIAMLTVSYHSLKAAIANPVESLRHE